MTTSFDFFFDSLFSHFFFLDAAAASSFSRSRFLPLAYLSFFSLPASTSSDLRASRNKAQSKGSPPQQTREPSGKSLLFFRRRWRAPREKNETKNKQGRMRRAVSVLRSRALGWRSEATLSDGAKTTSRGMAMAALDDDCFFYSSSRRSSLDAAAAPSASSSSSSSVAFPTSSSSTPSSVRSAHTSAPAASAAASAAAAAAATTSPRFFITGARGQIGIELTRELAKTHGAASIVASDLPAAVAAGRALPGGLVDGVHYVACDVTDREGLSRGEQLGWRRDWNRGRERERKYHFFLLATPLFLLSLTTSTTSPNRQSRNSGRRKRRDAHHPPCRDAFR